MQSALVNKLEGIKDFFLLRKSVRRPASRPAFDIIDVKKLIADYDIAEHIRRADNYFKDLSISDLQFRKPFMGVIATELIPKLGVVLSNLDLFHGARVLDFGAGSGWLSQWLALMGCEVVAADVSPRILELGKKYTSTKYPEVVDKITFLPFDGHHLDLQSASVDRVVCFDSFHHVPNQEQVLREFYRVLTPTGRAVFCEPGPHHSLHATAQYEMRLYGVIENDIHIQDIWKTAKTIGFERIDISVFMNSPVNCSMEDFRTLWSFPTAMKILYRIYRSALKPLYGGERLFTLYKGAELRDSRAGEGLKAEINANLEDRGNAYYIRGTAKNVGSSTWRLSGSEPGSVNAGIMLRLPDGTWKELQRIYFVDAPVSTGETREFEIEITKDRVGDAEIYIDLVSEALVWFSLQSGALVRLK